MLMHIDLWIGVINTIWLLIWLKFWMQKCLLISIRFSLHYLVMHWMIYYLSYLSNYFSPSSSKPCAEWLACTQKLVVFIMSVSMQLSMHSRPNVPSWPSGFLGASRLTIKLVQIIHACQTFMIVPYAEVSVDPMWRGSCIPLNYGNLNFFF